MRRVKLERVRARWVIGLAGCLLGSTGCDHRSDLDGPAPSASLVPKTPDRLAPGELAEGKSDLFGLKLPIGMKTEANFPTSGQASGRVSVEQLTNYLRQRLDVARVELAGSHTVFDKAAIRGAPPDRRFRVEIVPKGRDTKLVVEWLNPKKPPAAKGISEQERWKRAGLGPDGKMLNPQELE